MWNDLCSRYMVSSNPEYRQCVVLSVWCTTRNFCFRCFSPAGAVDGSENCFIYFILFYFILCRLCWFGVPAAQDSCQSGKSVWHILCRMVPKSLLSAVHSSFEHAWYPTRNKLLQVQVLYARNLPLSPPFFFKMWLGTFYQLRFCLYNEELNNGVTVGAFSPSWREQKRKMNASTEFWLTNPKERTHVEGIVVGLQWRIQLSLIK